MQVDKQVPPGNSKRRTKFWKQQPIVNYADEEEVVKPNSCSSVENSRRGSVSSSQGSPIKVSPKKGKDQKSKKSASAVGGGQDDVHRKSRRNSKEKIESPRDENRLSAGARLYRVMEEQALGEAIELQSANLYTGESRRMSLCSPVTSSPNFRYSQII